jgi:putative phage-type endonuclease
MTDAMNPKAMPIAGSAEWLAARRKGVGGSDAAAIVGLSPWRTSLEVYLDKIGELVTDETPDMRRGTLLEPVVLQMYADETGRFVHKPSGIITNPKMPFALANLDGIASDVIAVEAKTARTHTGWGEPGTSDIPLVYLCQVQHYLMVSELSHADVAVLFGDFEFAIYPVEPDPEFQSMLMELEAAFWEMVKSRTPPDPVSAEDVRRRWPKAKFLAGIPATETDRDVAQLVVQVKEHIASCEQWQENAEAYLKARIGENDALLYGEEPIATWKNTKGRTGFDKARLKTDHPELFDQYITTGEASRQFLLKGKAQCLTTGTHTPTLPTFQLPQLPALDCSPFQGTED